MTAFWTVLGILVLLVLWLVFMYNGLVRKRTVTEEAWSGISVQLKRRHDLIPNLVATAKGLSTFEKSLLENVTAARAAKTVGDVSRAEGALSSSIRGFVATMEAYPQIKSDQAYMDVMKNLTSLEDEIQMSRRYYNGAVRELNTAVQVFPTNIFANMFGFKKAEFFELDSPDEGKAPEVRF